LIDVRTIHAGESGDDDSDDDEDDQVSTETDCTRPGDGSEPSTFYKGG
jgi:hypothetical protein